jgi:hypothetical protein
MHGLRKGIANPVAFFGAMQHAALKEVKKAVSIFPTPAHRTRTQTTAGPCLIFNPHTQRTSTKTAAPVQILEKNQKQIAPPAN